MLVVVGSRHPACSSVNNIREEVFRKQEEAQEYAYDQAALEDAEGVPLEVASWNPSHAGGTLAAFNLSTGSASPIVWVLGHSQQ
jgi:hypothetical protein